jgi:hypothetical protein
MESRKGDHHGISWDRNFTLRSELLVEEELRSLFYPVRGSFDDGFLVFDRVDA